MVSMTACVAIDAATAAVVFFVFMLPRWSASRYGLFIRTCLYVYGFSVLWLTGIIPVLIPIPSVNMSLSRLHANLVPYIDYLQSNGDFVRQIVLNVALTVPLGIMYPFIYRKGLKETVLAGTLVSIVIETLQLLSVRGMASCDITDVIDNTIGAAIGYGLYRALDIPARQALGRIIGLGRVRTYTVATPVKKAVVGVIIAQLVVRSIAVAF